MSARCNSDGGLSAKIQLPKQIQPALPALTTATLCASFRQSDSLDPVMRGIEPRMLSQPASGYVVVVQHPRSERLPLHTPASCLCDLHRLAFTDRVRFSALLDYSLASYSRRILSAARNCILICSEGGKGCSAERFMLSFNHCGTGMRWMKVSAIAVL